MELIDEIMEWELKHNLFEKGFVRGFAFYSYLRRELVNTALNSRANVTTDPFASKGQEDTGLKLFMKLTKRGLRTDVRDADLLILCHPRRQKSGDVYESVFTDFLTEEFPNSVTLERLFDNHSHYEPALTKNLCYTDRVTLKSYIYRIFKQKFCKKEYSAIKNEVKAIMEEPMKELEAAAGIDLKRKTYYERAVTLYYFCKIRRPDYEKFLDKVRPKVMAEVVCKSVDAMLLNDICRDRGIPVVELQHSLLGGIAKYPAGIYEKQSPEYYLSYSDYWSEYQTYPIAPENVHSCGSVYFERQVKKYKTEKRVKSDGKQTVLFISGPTYGKAMAQTAVGLKKASGGNVNIIYKLHPDEFGSWRKLYPELVENEINVIDSRDVSIYEYFNDSDAQVGVFSTAIYEGLAFDIDTYILDNPFAGEFVKFCEDGYGTLVGSGEELWAALEKKGEAEKNGGGVTGDTAAAGGTSLAEKFWKSNARENIVREIRKIMAERS